MATMYYYHEAAYFLNDWNKKYGDKKVYFCRQIYGSIETSQSRDGPFHTGTMPFGLIFKKKSLVK
jgi:hypothetical protein